MTRVVLVVGMLALHLAVKAGAIEVVRGGVGGGDEDYAGGEQSGVCLAAGGEEQGGGGGGEEGVGRGRGTA